MPRKVTSVSLERGKKNKRCTNNAPVRRGVAKLKNSVCSVWLQNGQLNLIEGRGCVLKKRELLQDEQDFAATPMFTNSPGQLRCDLAALVLLRIAEVDRAELGQCGAAKTDRDGGTNEARVN
jgi:hypothetical protein